jgi:ribosomal protein L37AE/L43A
MAQGIVEDTPYIDIQARKNLENGNYKMNSYSLQESFKVQNGTYTHDNGQFIYSDTTKVGYGLRTWYVCPSCLKNTKRLYKPTKQDLWKCRGCHKLVYMKSRLSGNEFEYVTHRIRELQHELEVSKDNYIPYMPTIVNADIEWLPLFKPKYMRQSTFDALRLKLEFLIIERVRLWMAMV